MTKVPPLSHDKSFLLISFFSFSRPQDPSCQARLQHPRPNRNQSEGSRWASTALVRLRPPRQLRDFCQSADRCCWTGLKRSKRGARWRHSSLHCCLVLPRQLLQILQRTREPEWCHAKKIEWQRDCRVASSKYLKFWSDLSRSIRSIVYEAKKI